MSRRHFEALAAILKIAHAQEGNSNRTILGWMQFEIEDLCARENSRFDRERFRRASGWRSHG